MTRQAISSDQAPAALGPYSQAIVASGFVYCSGTAGIDPADGLPVEYDPDAASQSYREDGTWDNELGCPNIRGVAAFASAHAASA